MNPQKQLRDLSDKELYSVKAAVEGMNNPNKEQVIRDINKEIKRRKTQIL